MESAVLDGLQKAAFNPALWPDVLQLLSEKTGSEGAILIPIENRVPGLLCSPKMEPLLGGYFEGGWNHHDERYRSVPKMMRRGVVTEDDFISRQDITQSPYYRDFLEKYRLRWFAGLGFTLGGELWCIALQRRIDQGPFKSNEINQLRNLLVPLHNTATICQKLASARITGMLDAIDLLDQPCIVLDKDARVMSINRCAETAFACSINSKLKRLNFHDPRSKENLTRLLSSAMACSLQLPHEAVTTVFNSRNEGFVARAVVLERSTSMTFSGARMLLIFRSLSKKPAEPSLLKAYFGLTIAEARLASTLSSGLSIRDAADLLGITYETARSTLKAIHNKTDVEARGKLIALLSRFGA